MSKLFVLVSVCISTVAFAQPQDFPDKQPDKQLERLPGYAPAPPVVDYSQRSERHFGVHIGVNIGLFAIDLQVSKFYLYAAAGAGVTLLSNNTFGAFAGGVGYTVPIKDTRKGRWKLDLLLMTTPGWVTGGWPNGFGTNRIGYVGIGAGAGFRYEADSGFSVGFKIPLFGYAISSITNNNSAAGVGLFYVASGAALPIVSFGYRF